MDELFYRFSLPDYFLKTGRAYFMSERRNRFFCEKIAQLKFQLVLDFPETGSDGGVAYVAGAVTTD